MASYRVLHEGGVQREHRPIIYGLIDPREPDRVRYVGQTVSARDRYVHHVAGLPTYLRYWRHQPAGARQAWMLELLRDGVSPSMVLLEEVASRDRLYERERHWIDQLSAQGQADLNTDPRTAKNRRRVA